MSHAPFPRTSFGNLPRFAFRIALLLLLLAAPAPAEEKPLTFDDQWTPKGHLGKGDLPREKEADWVDGRSREMDFGPFVTTSLVVPELGVPRKPFVDRKTPGDERNAIAGDERVVKALAIKLGGRGVEARAAVLFDKTTMTLRCGWTGTFLEHSSLRYGLLEAPQIGGDLAFATVSDAWESEAAPGKPVAREWQGLYRHGHDVALAYTVGGRAVREVNDVEGGGERAVFVRTMEIGPGTTPLSLTIARQQDRRKTFVVATGAELSTRGDRTILSLPARDAPMHVRVFVSASGIAAPATQPLGAIERLAGPRERIWGAPLVTKGQIGKPAPGSPFAVDTITMPYDNPHKALFFAGGFDFAEGGACYLCTAHGDVWRVTGIDDKLDEIRWQRFATGLYQPLGLKVRDGKVFVLGRDQITRLHDVNADGEADFYENFNDDCTDHGQPHAYAMCLETDAAGNFYFLKSGAPKTPHGGTLLKLSADGKDLSVHATGFRHANGLSVSPDGATITTADNEGNWVPTTRLDIIGRGKFYGHVPTAHTVSEPTGPGEPLCWLPRAIDNSAGGQAWVPDGAWGQLSGALLHFSFGRCTANVILKEQVDGVWQGGAVVLPTGQFLSGVHRGRFVGDVLYVCGLNGWSSEAAKDGCFQRVRYVGGPIPLPTGVHAYANGIELTFAEPLDVKIASNPKRYAVEAWNYRWSREYGSKDYEPSDPTREGRASLLVKRADASADGRKVFLTVDGLAPVMQLRVQAGLRTAAGAALPVEYYGTVHHIRAPYP
jgi:hypothetical protein